MVDLTLLETPTSLEKNNKIFARPDTEGTNGEFCTHVGLVVETGGLYH